MIGYDVHTLYLEQAMCRLVLYHTGACMYTLLYLLLHHWVMTDMIACCTCTIVAMILTSVLDRFVRIAEYHC